MRHRQAALGYHLYQVAQTELEPKIPAHAQNDDFAVEVATLEQLRYRLQLAHRRPQPAQHANVVDRPPPFAPEPSGAARSSHAPPEPVAPAAGTASAHALHHKCTRNASMRAVSASMSACKSAGVARL